MTEVRTYDASSKRTGMLRNLLPIVGYPILIWRNRFMVHNFFFRELMGRFHGSFLGVFWILVQPMFLFTIYYLVFGLLLGNWKYGQMPDPHEAIYLFSGVIVFHSLVEATTQCCTIIVANGNLVKKVAFPSEVIVIPAVMVSLVLYIVGAAVCSIAGMALGVLHPGPALLAVPVILLVQFALSTGIGLLLANLEVFIRDVSQLWRIATMAWMFLTPVFWRPELILSKFEDFPTVVSLFLNLNPAYPLLQAHRIALGGVDPSLGDLWTHIGVAAMWAVFFMCIGYSSFVGYKHKYADLV